jgi:hypothetical protein
VIELNENTKVFDEKMISWEAGNPFPYVDPPRGWKPPFIIDAENYLQWFERLFKSTIGQGYVISFVVGDPGAGKSHLLCHLDYLFNADSRFKGVYSTFSAGQSKISSMDLWRDFFLNNDVIEKIKELLPLELVKAHNFRSNAIKENIIGYIEGTLQLDSLNESALQNMAAGVSSLLVAKGAGMCMIIDNIDEYFRYLSSLHESIEDLPVEEETSKQEQQEKEDINYFFGTLRTTCRDMPNFLLLIACTSLAYAVIERHAVTVDRTFAGRIQYQSEVLGPLSKSQAFELVHEYLDWWCQTNGINLPTVDGSIARNPEGEIISVYPFSKSAIEEIYEVTGQFARDIKTICNECINQMRIEQKARIVKDEYLEYAIEEAHKKRPQIIPSQNFEAFVKKRTRWLNETMELKLRKVKAIAEHKYPPEVETEVLIDALDVYATNLGIVTEAAPSIQNKENLQWIGPQLLRIWKYKDGKRVLISHIFSDERPYGKTYFKNVKWKDISDAISYIDAGVATHILFVMRWSGGFSEATRQYWYRTSQYDPIIETIRLDDNVFEIIGAVEDGGSDTKDLIEHIDKKFKLKETLDRLVAKSKPVYEPPEKEKRLSDRG